MQKMILLNQYTVKLFFIIGAVLLAIDTNAQLTNFGNLYIHPGGNLSVSGTVTNSGAQTDLSNSGTLQLTGDFTNNGNDLNAAGTGTVIFNGIATQNISGTQATSFYNVTQTNAGNVILSNNQLINNTLSLTAGSLLLNGNTLTLNGAVNHTSGSLSSTQASGLVLNGSAAKNLYFKPGSRSIKALTVNASASSVTLDDSLNIAASTSGTLTANGVLNSNGYLTIQSNASGTARVAASTGSVNGDVTVERYFPAQRSWRLLTSPLTGTQSIFNAWQNGGLFKGNEDMLITGPSPSASNGLDISPLNNYSMYTWNSSTQALAGVADTKNTMLSSNAAASADNKPYYVFVRGDRTASNTNIANVNATTLTSTGKLQIGTQVFPANANAGKYTMIGNPYASPVDFNAVTRNNLVKRFYVMDPNLNEVGGYVMLDDLDNDNSFTKSVSTSAQDNNIQSSQAFFVETIASAPASLTFSESNKSAVNNLLVFRPAGNNETAILRTSLYIITDSSTKLADATFAEFNNSFNPGVNGEDALKFGNTNENLALLRNGTPLCAERRPELTETDTLFFKLTKARQLNYRFLIAANTVSHAGLQAFLEDSYLAIKTPLDLDGTTPVDFTVNGDAGSAMATRFRIVFSNTLQPLPVRFISVLAYKNEEAGIIKWSVENELNVSSYTVERSADGVHFEAIGTVAASHLSTYTLKDNSITTTSYYRVRSNDRDGKILYSYVIRLFVEAKNSSVTVFPNPVTGNVVNLRLTNIPVGVYSFQLLNSDGQVIFNQSFTHANEVEVAVKLDKKIAAGIYQLLIKNPEQKVIRVSVNIQ